MYYATFKGVGISDVAEFETEKERDDWVDFEDEVSIWLEETKENCIFEREAITDKREIRMIELGKLQRIRDPFDDRIIWHIRTAGSKDRGILILGDFL